MLSSRPISAPYRRDYHYPTMLRDCICLIGPGAIFRRSVLETEGGRDPKFRFVGDFDFWLRVGLRGAFARVPITLATHRIHSDSASVAQRGADMAAEYVEMIETLYQRPDLPGGVVRIRAESFSSAYYIAAAQALRTSYPQARQYFRRSLRAAPVAYLQYPTRLIYLLSVLLLPERFHQALFRRWKALSA